MKTHCKYDELVSSTKLKSHPKNRNKHSVEQIARLAKLLEYQGVRAPIVVSKLSGHIVKGHGTLEAIQKNGWKQAPVVYQEFENEEQEYAFVQSDNAIANWAELDLSGINLDLADLGPDFNIDMLGLQSFLLEPADKFIEKDLDSDLWDEEFEGPQKVFKIVVSVQQESYKQKVLDLLNIKKVKSFGSGSLLSVLWPEIAGDE